MILRSSYSEPTMPHNVMDRLTAARVTSLVTALAGLVFMTTPILYFNAGLQTNAWNERVVGFLVLVFALIRLRMPAASTAASYCNAGLGCWMVASPWIFAYTDDHGRLTNALVTGVMVIGYSLSSATYTKSLGAWARDQDKY